MAFTQTITVNNSGYTAVTVQSPATKNIRIGEDPGVGGYPTTDFYIAKPTNAATPIRVTAGNSYVFFTVGGLFVQGQIVGYVKTVSGSTTFDQDEDQP